jgi:hypothetical protein
LDDWRWICESEEYAEALADSYGTLNQASGHVHRQGLSTATIEEAYAQLRAYVRGFTRDTPGDIESIPAAVDHELKDAVLTTTVLLGECVDQGLRPPKVYQHLFTVDKNPNWRVFLKNHPAPKPPVSLSAYTGQLIPPPPPTYRLNKRACNPGSLRPPAWWGAELEAIWRRLGLSTHLPRGISLIPGRPTLLGIRRLVDQVDAAAREGLAELIPPDPTDCTDRDETEASQVGETCPCKVPWYHTLDEQKPAKYAYGPVVGTKAQLSRWYLPGRADPRALETASREKRVWVIQRGRYDYEAWFSTKVKFDEVEQRSNQDSSEASD